LKVYFISGLGADERVFKNIQLPQQHEVVHLNWTQPNKNESLKEYALRMADRIDRSEKFGLVGLSLGGMIATEIAKAYHPEKTVLISSIPLSAHMPVYFKWAGRLGLHKIVPIWFIKNMARAKRLFSTETSEDKKMIRAMIDRCDPEFIRWAFNAALSWRNEELPANFTHIHGKADIVLPLRFTKPGYIIEKADHLMVMTNARKINGILKEIFK
jgi:pimeloyl-ACP methyl ester carboxylesterase